jgi:hypothetical protein
MQTTMASSVINRATWRKTTHCTVIAPLALLEYCCFLNNFEKAAIFLFENQQLFLNHGIYI